IINNSELPAVVVGQYESGVIDELVALDRENKLLLLPEIISNQPGAERTAMIEAQKAENVVLPSLVIHIGGNLVNKWLKIKLRRSKDLKVIRVDETNDTPDTFSHLEMKVKCNERKFFEAIAPLLRHNENVEKFKEITSSVAQVSCFKEQIVVSLYDFIKQNDPSAMLFLGNSSVVRIAARLIESGEVEIYCNRGVNGIEGSVSVAAGCASVCDRNVYAVVGDLSFFYDVNSLWNTELRQNLRVVLLNDHGGAIFEKLDGLSNSAALHPYISARHDCNARGIALSYGCDYHAVANEKQLEETFREINLSNNNKPILVEYDTYLDTNQTV
ncbi:MAG: thiamine pyrophosphate-dependent enzyme, partial [Bacteroidaceae bacterium]